MQERFYIQWKRHDSPEAEVTIRTRHFSKARADYLVATANKEFKEADHWHLSAGMFSPEEIKANEASYYHAEQDFMEALNLAMEETEDGIN